MIGNAKLEFIFSKFDTKDEACSIVPFGGGHINGTYLVTGNKGKYTLQRLNTNVFREPEFVMHNVCAVTDYLSKKIRESGGDPLRETLNVIRTKDGNTYYYDGEYGFFRVFTFVDGARSYDKVERPEHFFNAARAFGKFQNMLSEFPAEELCETIPNFHNTVSRYYDFEGAVKSDRVSRAKEVSDEIAFIRERKPLASKIVDAIETGRIPLRVTHNDTKYNNILIDDESGEAICVIDLDTVMPGSGLYDYGDSLRFGASTADEDEPDISKVSFDLELFRVFTRGYIGELYNTLTDEEYELMPYAPMLMAYEVGMRFLSDHLNGDIYFKISREGHNLDRARAQLKLVADMESKIEEMKKIVNDIKEQYK